MTVVVNAENLTKKYNSLRAVDNINFQVLEKERQGDGSLVFPRRKIMKKDKRTVPLSLKAVCPRNGCKAKSTRN